MPPPSYGESTWGRYSVEDKDDEHMRGDKDFLPKYAMYNTQISTENVETPPPSYGRYISVQITENSFKYLKNLSHSFFYLQPLQLFLTFR